MSAETNNLSNGDANRINSTGEQNGGGLGTFLTDVKNHFPYLLQLKYCLSQTPSLCGTAEMLNDVQKYLLDLLRLKYCIDKLNNTHAASRTCYGNIDKLHPKGQSNGGVAASNNDAQHDMPYLKQHKNCYDASANKHCIQASVIAAIASRESRGGLLLQRTGGYGDGGRAWGIMQCDLYASGLPCKSCDWDSCCHIEMMVGQLIVPYINQVSRKHPSWSAEQKLQGAVAAYNFGVSNVVTWERLDIGSTHNDYSNDVIARAQYLRRHGWD